MIKSEGKRMVTAADYMSLIGEKTKVPLSWLIASLVGVSGIVLYISDMRSRLAIQEVSTIQVNERLTSLENDYKDELKAIRLEITKLNDRLIGGRK